MEVIEEYPETAIHVAKIVPGRYQPRSEIDKDELESLADSIRAQNLLTSILLRPIGEGMFEIVAGERRWRAYKLAFGEDAKIPARVKELTDEQAKAAALTENIDRKGMSPLDEAEGAAKVLADCKGDRKEAARVMGWKPDVLDRRLSLMYATDAVRAALRAKKILLGHVELLAACRKETQENVLQTLLQQEKPMTVESLRALINTAALNLDKAIFEKSDCASCVHNSGNQSVLFAESIDGGRCTNKECFDRKTEAELEARATALREEFQVVRIARPGENYTVIPLVADGPKGVGAEQASACRTCEHFGAAVSAAPDKMGMVYKDLCMDVPCNVRMVAKRIAVEKAQEQAPQQAQNPQGGAVAGANGAGQGRANDTKAAAGKPKHNGNASNKVVHPEPSARVKEYREKLWRAIYQRVVNKADVVENRSVLLALCLTHPSYIDANQLRTDLASILSLKSAPSMRDALQAVRDLDQKQLGQVLQSLASTVTGGLNGMPIADITTTLKSFEVKISDHWKVSKDFFDLLTKNEIEAVAEELGIKAAMGKEFAKVRGQSKEDFVKAVMSVPDFDYRGRIPKLVTW